MASDKSKFNPYDYVAVVRSDKEAKTISEGRVMARDTDHARLIAATKLDPEYHERLDEVEITVRPF